jgi:glycosyltransferase involved in cell wall biosynthesis
MLFVHNLLSESRRHCDDDVEDAVIKEADHFRRLDSEALIVANSHCVRAALIRDHDLNPDRVVVHYPGIESERFDHQRTFTLRHTARSRLRLAIDAPVIGFVTSGSLYKRGLDIFLSAAERIAASRNDARFLVVGSTALPDWAAAHPLFAEGRAFHRPRSGRPELWIAALDVFLYPARFEEFGMVVAEALALGVPIVTSRRVGATECMPAEYDPWLLDRPQGAGLADKALSLLDDDTARRRLARAGSASAAALDRQRYGHATSATILERAAEIGKAGRFA